MSTNKSELIYEKAEIYGAKSVDVFEIVCLFTGADKMVLQNIIKDFGSVQKGIENSAYYENKGGLTKRQRQKLELLNELIQRKAQLSFPEKKVIKSVRDAVSILSYMEYLDVEEFNVLLLDTKNYVKKIITVSKGTINSTVVHPREVFKSAIKYSTHSIILAHNHPSGNPKPSKEDLSLTSRLVEASKIIGINILDHVILGKDRYFSFAEEHLL